jgi:hypothetical protein
MMRIAAAVVAATLALGATAAATAPARTFNSGDKLGCHAAWDVHLHGLSGVGIPTAQVEADLQDTSVTGTKPYKAEALALFKAIRALKGWKAPDATMVKSCGSHH